jgi:hypothetical protein
MMSYGYSKTITPTPSGAWSWSVRDPHQQRLASGTDTSQGAADLAAAAALATHLVLAGVLRDDGEPMSGNEDVDSDNAAPSNVAD